MPNCWRCGQPLDRPNSRFCDNCGANLSSSRDYVSPEQGTDFDSYVAMLFTIVGIGAIFIGIVAG